MSRLRLRGGSIVVAITLFTSPGEAQSSGRTTALTIDDSLFLPVRSPEMISFGYPPNEIFLPRIMELIRHEQFDSLETMFDQLASDVRRDVRNEVRFSDAFDATDRNDPALLANLTNWISAKPRSAHARAARARYHFAAAWRRRGYKYIKDTPTENVRGMEESAQKAITDVVAGLEIDSTHIEAYALGIGVLQLAGTHQAAIQLMSRGLSTNRGSYILTGSFVRMLWPRWGGTEDLIVQFAERAAQDSARNPRLVTLRGAVYQNRANDSSIVGNQAGAVRELNKALAYGPERRYLADRGEAYYRLGAYEYAFHDLRAVMIERSQDKRVLDFYGRTLVELATRARPAIRPTILERAVEVLRLAVYLDPSNERAQAALDRATQLAGK